MSVLGWIIKVLSKLDSIYQLLKDVQKQQQVNQAEIDKRLDTMQADIDVVKKVIGVGVPVQETIMWGTPTP